MSFDLIFCNSSGEKVSASSLLKYFETRPYMECSREEDKFQVMYQNPSTGVYGIFSYTPIEKETDIPPDWFEKGATGLSVSINYLRPSFFALEIMPEIEALCIAKDLLVLDLQDSEISGKGKPKRCVATEVIASWKRGNQFAILGASLGNFLPPYLDNEKSLYLGRYMTMKDVLEKRFEADDIFVPQMVVVRRQSDEQLKTAIMWANGIPVVLPHCDIIIFQKIHSKGFLSIGKKEEIGWIKYETVAETIRPFLRKYTVKDSTGLELQVLYPNAAEKARESLMKIPFDGKVEEWVGIAMDGFIDMKPERPQ